MGLFLRLDKLMICWEKTTQTWKSPILHTIIPRLVVTQAVRAIGWIFSKWIFIFRAQRPWGWTVRNTSLSGVDNLAWSSKKKALSRHNTWDYIWGPSFVVYHQKVGVKQKWNIQINSSMRDSGGPGTVYQTWHFVHASHTTLDCKKCL